MRIVLASSILFLMLHTGWMRPVVTVKAMKQGRTVLSAAARRAVTLHI
jgi:hypothetical protein